MNSLMSQAKPLPAILRMHDLALDNPSREIRTGGLAIGVLMVALLTSASLIRIDAAMHSNGVVRVDGNRQTVQSALGGVISAIPAREGARVKAGDILVELAAPEVRAQERSLASRVFGLQAEIARIEAELTGGSTVAAPPEWSTLAADDLEEARRALSVEQINLAAQRDLMQSQRSVLRQQIAQANDQASGYRDKRAAAIRQGEYAAEELRLTKGLFEKGYATRQRVLALQRETAGNMGEKGAIEAEIARLGDSSAQTKLQMLQVNEQRRRDITDRLRSARSELQTALPQWRSARKQLDGAVVRAPTAGFILGLASNTIGGVVAPGGHLMDIVPTEKRLVVEASVAPEQAEDLRVGQAAKVRLTTPGQTLPDMEGKISRISADAVTDERTGHAYYSLIVNVAPADLAKYGDKSSDMLRPGTPVSVTVPLQKRTMMQYLLSPFTRRLAGAMSER